MPLAEILVRHDATDAGRIHLLETPTDDAREPRNVFRGCQSPALALVRQGRRHDDVDEPFRLAFWRRTRELVEGSLDLSVPLRLGAGNTKRDAVTGHGRD